MRRDHRPHEIGDAWYESEESTRRGMIHELQRIKRRTQVRPVRVLLLAALITAAFTYKFVTKARIYEADIVLALDEGAMTSRSGIPFDQLKEYVERVLLPDNKLEELIERRGLHRLRTQLGMPWAVQELRDQIEIEIWKNSFVYYHEEDAKAQKSARIGITVLDEDPDDAFQLARDLGAIIAESHEEQLRKTAGSLARELGLARDALAKRAQDLSAALAVKQTALVQARQQNKNALAAVLLTDVTSLSEQEKRTRSSLAELAASPETLADRAAEAGLDTSISIVEERRPDRQQSSGLVLAMVIIVVGTGAFIGSAMMLGAFDTRVHDTDDIARLGLPVLGHVPAFPGDEAGSLKARGVERARGPLFLRWRS